MSHRYMNDIVKKNILGIEISNTTDKEVLEYIFDSLTKKREPYYIVTPNPEMVMRSEKDEEFKAVLNSAEIALCDGVGLFLAAHVLGKPLRQRITGVDLLEKLCKESVRKPVNIGFLGGKEGVAERAAECLQKKYGELNVAFIGEEWPDRPDRKQMENGKWKMENKVDILFVAFGFPKQEKWMAENREKGIYKVAIGVGGAFDYLSGTIPRAPQALQVIGLEWFYRLIRQPWRWRRQLALISFIWLVSKERFKSRETTHPRIP